MFSILEVNGKILSQPINKNGVQVDSKIKSRVMEDIYNNHLICLNGSKIRIIKRIRNVINVPKVTGKNYHLIDGINLTVYYEDGWRLASTNSCDISDKNYISSKTYGECFNECLEQYGELDKSRIYELIMVHPELTLTAKEMKLYSYKDDKFDLVPTGTSPFGTVGFNKYNFYITRFPIWNHIRRALYNGIPNAKNMEPEEKLQFIINRTSKYFENWKHFPKYINEDLFKSTRCVEGESESDTVPESI